MALPLYTLWRVDRISTVALSNTCHSLKFVVRRHFIDAWNIYLLSRLFPCRRTIKGDYFPDDSTTGSMYSGEIERWEDRAAYFEAAFKMLVDAGWTVHVCDANGVSVLKRLKSARAHAQKLVDDPSIRKMSAHFATISGLHKAGEKPVGKLVRGRKRILEALDKAIRHVEGHWVKGRRKLFAKEVQVIGWL